MTFAWWPGKGTLFASFCGIARPLCWMTPIIHWAYLNDGSLVITFKKTHDKRIIKPGDCVIFREDGTFFQDLNYLPKYEIK